MKKQILIFVFACFGLQAAPALDVVNNENRDPRFNRHNRAETGVELYKQPHFRGEYLLITRDWSCQMDRDFCINIESIFVPEGFEVWAYNRRNFRGHPIVLNESWNGRGRGSRMMRNQIRSIRIVKRRQAQRRMPRHFPAQGAQVIVFDRRFNGQQMVLRGDWSVGRHQGFHFNDRISSIYVPRGYKVRIYEHANFQGAFMDVYGDWSPGPRSFWNNRISSIQIIPLNPRRTRRF